MSHISKLILRATANIRLVISSDQNFIMDGLNINEDSSQTHPIMIILQ